MTELDPAILDGLLEYDTPTICNAIEEMEVRDPIDGYMGWDVRCLYPDLGRMVGYAVTATGRSTVPGSPKKGDGFAQWYELVEEVTQAGGACAEGRRARSISPRPIAGT